MGDKRYKQLLAAVRKIHRAGLAPETWPEALEAIARAFEARGACMFNADLTDGTTTHFYTCGVEQRYTAAYAAYYNELDPWLHNVDPEWKAGEPLRGSSIVPDITFCRTEHYNDFLKPQDFRFLLTGYPRRTTRDMDILSVFRGVRHADFDDTSMEMYRVVLEHVGQAVEAQRTIGRLRDRAGGLAAALEHTAGAVVLLARDGRVIHMNSSADAIFSAADGLSVNAGRIEIRAADAWGELNDVLRKGFGTTPSGVRRPRRVIPVPRLSGKRPYMVRVFPAGLQDDEVIDLRDIAGLPAFVLTITDPDNRPRNLSAEDLRTAYGLTRTEALVAAELAVGRTIAEVAEHRGIAVDTARKHLKSVFEKTGTHRQAELVERLLREAVWTSASEQGR